MPDIYELYAAKKSKFEKLEKELSELKDLIIGDMRDKDTALAETKWGKFTLQGRASLTYTDAVDKAQQAVKELKKHEEQSGVAKSITTDVLILKK